LSEGKDGGQGRYRAVRRKRGSTASGDKRNPFQELKGKEPAGGNRKKRGIVLFLGVNFQRRTVSDLEWKSHKSQEKTYDGCGGGVKFGESKTAGKADAHA